MWKEYRKRFLTTQILIGIGIFLAWQVGKVPPKQLLLIFFATELGALIGAWFGANLKRQLENPQDDLPLRRR